MSKNAIQSSKSYNKFKFMHNNRDVYKYQVSVLKQKIESDGNITEHQPILVNEKFEIIDGQHRFTALKELGLPVYYTMQKGLTAEDAMNMNLMHKSWSINDYAKHFAESGNENYKKYLELRGDYGFNHSITMIYALGTESNGNYRKFRTGEFQLTDFSGAHRRLQLFSEISDVLKNTDKDLARAVLKAINTTGYNQRRMVKKLNQVGDKYVRRFGNMSEYLRAIDLCYNYQMSAKNCIRFF